MGKDTFKRVGPFSHGYDVDEVNSFLEKSREAYSNEDGTIDENDVRSIGFTRTRRGYDTVAVDAALDRLEAAFIHLHRANVIAEEGEQAWLLRAYEAAKSLYPRLLRPRGERFADADGWGYRKQEVDALMGRLARYFDGEAELTSQDLRQALFPEAKNSAAYDESVVDVFIERAVTVLTSVE